MKALIFDFALTCAVVYLLAFAGKLQFGELVAPFTFTIVFPLKKPLLVLLLCLHHEEIALLNHQIAQLCLVRQFLAESLYVVVITRILSGFLQIGIQCLDIFFLVHSPGTQILITLKFLCLTHAIQQISHCVVVRSTDFLQLEITLGYFPIFNQFQIFNVDCKIQKRFQINWYSLLCPIFSHSSLDNHSIFIEILKEFADRFGQDLEINAFPKIRPQIGCSRLEDIEVDWGRQTPGFVLREREISPRMKKFF